MNNASTNTIPKGPFTRKMERRLGRYGNDGHCLPDRESRAAFDQAQWHKIFGAEQMLILVKN
ncbi:hypothetical protein [Nitrosomonas sp.]|uniref:hypothetical protein n=1 Tax=Nitrosomonas sp. TaxID=42353 RepID=UPI00262E5B59|nr:hypothetical protein [Nitrosomonas sp.]